MSATDQRSGAYEEMLSSLVDLIAPLRDLQRQRAVGYLTDKPKAEEDLWLIK